MSSQFDIRRFLDVRSATTPSFSARGSHITFLANITGVHQLWRVPRQGGWPVQLTFSEEPVRSAVASPRRDEVIFTMDKGGDECTQIYRVRALESLPAGDWEGWETDRLTDCPSAIHEFGGWSDDGAYFAFSSNRDRVERFDVYIQHADQREARRVATGPGGYYFAWGWSPNGRFLLIWEYASTTQQKLHILDLRSLELRTLSDSGNDESQYMWPCWSADSEYMYCVSTAGGLDLPSPARICVSTRKLDYLEQAEHETETIQASRDGRWVSWLLNVDGRSLLRVRNLQAGVTIEPEMPVAVAFEPAFSCDGNRIALSLDNPRLGRDIWVCDLSQSPSARPTFERLTYCARAGIPPSAVSEPELITYETFDGRRIPGWFSRPPATGGRLPPAVVAIHGGPEGQARPVYLPLTQYLIHRGYAVLAPNVRGSGGYGLEYRKLDDKMLRMDSVADMTHAGLWLQASGAVDPKRIAAMGASYGGFGALATAADRPALWAAVVCIAGVTNFITFLENTGPYRRAEREAEYGSLEEDREFLLQISPIHQVDRIICPILLMHGVNDPRVPIEGTEEYADALRRLGRDVILIRYPDEGHGLTKLHNQLDAYSRIADFLDTVFGKIE